MNAPENNIPDDQVGDETPEYGSLLDNLEIKKPGRKPREKREKTELPANPPGADRHFRPLGYDRDRFFFFADGSQQIHELSISQLGKKPSLLMLAPLDWWEREFATDSGFSGRAVDMAVNYLVQACRAKGVFSLERRRGRGVWLDGESIIIHAGDRLYINGVETTLLGADTEAVYERQAAIRVAIDDPLPANESVKVLDFCRSLSYEQTSHAYLHAGWLVTSIAAGALRWRPHIQINGPKGSGKTTIVTVNVRLLDGFCLSVTGETSAAGLRQMLASDAIPVIFDEAEGDSHRSSANLDHVIALMRHASAGTDAKVIKGGADGRATATTIQSCFCLASIRDQIQQAADQSRISVLSLRPATAASKPKFDAVTAPLANEISKPDFARRFQGRVFSMLPEVLASVRVFTEVAAAFFGDSRMGDQIGALMGGAWMLWNDRPPSEQQAREEMDALAWTEQNDLLAEASDEMACLRAILEAHIKVDGAAWHGDASVGELVAFVHSKLDADHIVESRRGTMRMPGEIDPVEAPAPGGISVIEADRALAMYGLRVDRDKSNPPKPTGTLLVSNTNGMLGRKVMAHTTWHKGWGKLLARLPGATKPNEIKKIGGHPSRCVAVDLIATGIVKG